MSLLVAFALAAAPAAGSCQAALGPLYEGIEVEALAGRVEGATLAGPAALVALRRERGDALITVVGGRFARGDFRGARLHNICFVETVLSGSDWRGAEARGIGFVRANLEGANLSGARMPGILLREPNAKDVNASGADWSGGRLDGGWDASFENVTLDRADLRGFDFACGITLGDGCPIERGFSLRGADLAGASLHSWWFEADFAGARLDRTQVGLHQLQDLGGAVLAGPLVLRGGDARVEISPAEVGEIVAAIGPQEQAPADRPSFDCGAARTRIERMICAEDAYSLRAYDVEMAGTYRRALAADPAIAASQRAWLAERDRCGDRSCLERAYARRQGQLLGGLGTPAWLRPGVRAFFVDEPVPLTESFRTTPLYRRILPAIVGGASSRVALRVNGDGSIDAVGDAIGGNAHMCSLGGQGLRFDPATGWFSGPWWRDDDGPPDVSPPPMRVLRFDGDTAEVFRNGHYRGEDDPVEPRPSDYASCGARAGFATMIRVPALDDEVDRMLESLYPE